MKIVRFCSLVLLLFALTSPLSAARLAKGESYSLPKEESLNTDLYFGGDALDIAGRVNGSLLAGCKTAQISGTILRNLFLACEKLTLNGTVTGDILACGSEMKLNGTVGGALRVAARRVNLKGTIGADILAGCQELTIDSLAEVKGDVIAGCQTLKINGTVNGKIRAAAKKVVINGTVAGDVNLMLGDDRAAITLTDNCRILGNLHYRAHKELNLDNTNGVKGEIKFIPLPRPAKPRLCWSKLRLGITIFSILAALVITFILIAICRQPLERAIENCGQRFGSTIGLGAVALFAPPVALIIAAIFIITIPALIIAKIGYLIILYLAKTLTGIFLGRILFRLFGAANVSLWLAGPLGVIIVYCLCAIPVIGWLFWLFVLLLGFGIFIRLVQSFTLTQKPVP